MKNYTTHLASSGQAFTILFYYKKLKTTVQPMCMCVEELTLL